jgi:hypothetical protein
LKKKNKIGNISQVYRKVRFLAGKYNKKPIQIKNKNKLNTANQKEILEIWKDSFSKLLSVTNNQEGKFEIKIPTEKLNIETKKFTFQELEKVIKTMKNGKSPGIDGVTTEMIKYGGAIFKREVLKICNRIYEENEIPWQMITNIIIPIPKKGDISDPANYRGIALMSSVTKIFNKLILNRIYDQVNNKLRENQRGFRRKCSTIQAINTVRRLIEGFNKKQLPIIVTFIDFTKAFDSINRERMWLILLSYGIPDKIVNAIKTIYNGSQIKVMFNGQFTESIEVKKGILQGDALSPFLFIIVLDYVMKNIPNDFGVTTHKNPDIKILDVEYADDGTIFNGNQNDAIHTIEHLEEEAKKVGLIINQEKTCFLTNIKDESEIEQLKHKFNRVTEFKYLGAQISSVKEDIIARRSKATVAFWSMKKIWQSKTISLKLKIKIFKTTCIPIFLYGSETWTINNEIKKKINSFATISYRHILGISKFEKRKNEEILERVKEIPLIEYVLNRQRNFLKNTFEKNDNDLIKRYVDYEPAFGKTKRGATQKLYKHYIKDLLINHVD